MTRDIDEGTPPPPTTPQPAILHHYYYLHHQYDKPTKMQNKKETNKQLM